MKKKYTKEEVLNEIELYHNHSWFEEIKERSQNHLNKTALKYRGLNITYGEYIDTCEKIWAPALKNAGVCKGMKVVVSIGSTPEYCYLFGALSMIGAVINPVSDEFDKKYLEEIINSSSCNCVFIGEDRFNNFLPVFENINKTVIPIDLDYSLKDGNPFECITDLFMHYDKNQYKENIEKLPYVKKLDKFLNEGKLYTGPVKEQSSLDDKFTITYSSGTTDGNRPKGIVHANRHYIVMGRYHDSEVSGIPNLKNSVTYSIIPSQSNSYVASVLSDTLMEGACVALDPITSNEYFIYGIKINKPFMAIASTSSWLNVAKTYYGCNQEMRKQFDFSHTLFPAAVGEPLGPGEEKYLNKFLSDAKFGTAITKLPHSITKMSACGGDCEHGSLFIRELRAYANLRKDKNIEEPIGLKTYDFVDIKALRRDGTYCNTYEYGRLVANSVCTMLGYEDDPESTKQFFIQDAYGKTWASLNCYGYIDKDRNIYMKGRIEADHNKIPDFMISDVIQKDTKNILSCSVVSNKIDNDYIYIAYIETQPNSKSSVDSIVKSLVLRCIDKFGENLTKKIYINVVDHKQSFPLTMCLKRNTTYLKELGLTENCVKASEFVKQIDDNHQLVLKKHI